MSSVEPSAWDEISVPELNSYHKKLAAANLKIPCHWAKDVNGSFLFLIELEGRYEAAFRKNLVKVNGIGIDLRELEPNRQVIVLTLERKIDALLFESLCRALVKVMTRVKTYDVALEVVFEHLRRWKVFLSGKKQLMSKEKVQGLYSELVFLKELLNSFGEEIAVNSWLGAEKNQHDFCFYKNHVEIKSLRGIERNTVHISSEDQLFSLDGSLFLIIYLLTEQVDDLKGSSLNQLVTEINMLIEDGHISQLFFQKLNDYGYHPALDYDQPIFDIKKFSTYLVDKSFPKITKDILPNGVSRVSYQIALEKIESFKCDANEVFEVRNG